MNFTSYQKNYHVTFKTVLQQARFQQVNYKPHIFLSRVSIFKSKSKFDEESEYGQKILKFLTFWAFSDHDHFENGSTSHPKIPMSTKE